MFWKSDTLGYEDLATTLSLESNTTVSRQALAKKMQKSSEFFEGLAQQALSSVVSKDRFEHISLAGVGGIYIADSSTISLKKSLTEIFPGTSAPGVKVHTVLDITQQTVADLALSPSKESDHSLKEAHKKLLAPKDLMIRDLGYFDMADLQRIDQQGAYFISRIPLSVKAFSDESGNPVDLWSKLASSRGFSFEYELNVGPAKKAYRVVAKRLPREKSKVRLAEAKRAKKRPLTKIEQAQAKWNLFVTNLTVDQASVEILGRLYELRWQVELFFKSIKGSVAVDRIKSASSSNVVLAYIWAKLAYAILMTNVRAVFMEETASEVGFIRWFRRFAPHQALMRSLLYKEDSLGFGKVLEKIARVGCRQEKRRRMTSRQKFDYEIRMEALV